MNFRQLDLNLLRVLCAIHRTGSVTEAGRTLALSQSATSNALARLRRAFADDLYVRSPQGLHPTRLAQRIAPQVAAHLCELEAALCASDRFDPASSHVHWRLSLSDLGEMMFLPALAQRVRAESPGSRLSNEAIDADGVSAALESREIDLAVGLLLPEHRGVLGEVLFQERFVAMAAAAWQPPLGKAGRTLTLPQLAASALAVAAPAATRHGSVQRMLARLKIEDHEAVHPRHYGALPELVTTTDLVAIVPEMFARAVAARYEVRVWDLPGAPLRYDVLMLWHQSVSGDPAQAWLRTQLRELLGRGAEAGEGGQRV